MIKLLEESGSGKQASVLELFEGRVLKRRTGSSPVTRTITPFSTQYADVAEWQTR